MSPTSTARTASSRRSARDLPAHSFQAERTIDAKGQYVIPGGIDVHTHLNMPFGGATSADDFESGTIAAAFGGTTSIVDFAIQYRGQTMRHALDDWRKRADGKAVIDYGFHMIITELEDAGLSEMDRMVRDEGITSFKLFMAYPGVFMVDDATIFRALRRTGENGGLVCMHAENGGVIDELVKEALAERGDGAEVPRADPSADGRGRSHRPRHRTLGDGRRPDLHRPSVGGARAREGEAGARHGPAGLCRDVSAVSLPLVRQLRGTGFEGSKYVMSPPLREKWHQDVLWKGLAKNDLQVISTDHCPFCMSEKALGKDDFSKIPNGAPGIETRLTLVHDGGVRPGRITMNRFVELCSTTPAKMFGLFPARGRSRSAAMPTSSSSIRIGPPRLA